MLRIGASEVREVFLCKVEAPSWRLVDISTRVVVLSTFVGLLSPRSTYFYILD